MNNFADNTDESLVQRALQERQAFAALYRRYVERIYRYVYVRIGGETYLAEDLTSQIFVDALEGLRQYRDQGQFAAWLFSIARRKIADHYRARRNQVSLDWLDNILHADDNPLQALLEAEDIRLARQIKERLNDNERELIELRYAAGLSFEEIAQLLGRKPSAVKMSLYRLLERLREEWQPMK
ncbi:MAG: sigma-70 family RNA polymerase sigma factor [Anaerolineales bacterium]|nr:sigma-70 family RNA polymerase sigma factor [Anaerolineales bacterium]